MEERFTSQRLIALRRVTRAVADLLRTRMTGYVTTLGPLLRPRAELTEYVPTGPGTPVRGGAKKMYDELASLYERVARARPFGLELALAPPLGPASPSLDMTPVEYTHAATSGALSKQVLVTSPLTWVLTPSGFGPDRLRDLLRERNRDATQVQRFLVQYLLMHAAVGAQPGVQHMLEALHFPVRVGLVPDLGELPIVSITCTVPTIRPPDEVLIESTEISGQDVFQEIVDIDAIATLRDPLREELTGLVRSLGETVPDEGRA
jgi:hypothetical protein